MVKIRIDPWMSLQNRGGVKLVKLTEASSFLKEDIKDATKADDRYKILDARMDAFS